jgi:hypothetical protein
MKRLAFLFGVVLLGLWQLPTWAIHVYSACSRGMYYCEKMHYVSITNDNKVSHFEAVVSTSDWEGPWARDNTPTTGIPLPAGWTRQDPTKNGVGEGVVIFGGNMIHYAVAFDSSATPHLVSSTYDLAGGTFLPDINGAMTATDLTPLTKNSSGIYGVAATVFDEKIFVFTNQFTLFTSDPKGQCYGYTNVISEGLANYNPLDAITFFPAEGPPRVMLLLSYPGTSAHGAAYVIWDGPSYIPLPSTSVKTFATDKVVQGGALVLGTVCGGTKDYFPKGAMVPCVQIFFMANHADQCGVYRYEYAIPSETLTSRGNSVLGDARFQFRLFPWYVAQTDPRGRTILRQHIAINEYGCSNDWCTGTWWRCYALYSDFLVPQNEDTTGYYGWQGTPTVTLSGDTEEETAIRRNYWSLVGVILGPPPYALNERLESDVKKTSNVIYGEESSGDIDHTNTWSNSVMVSSETELKVGLSKAVGLTAKLDVGYAHGWEGSHSTITSTSAGIEMTCGSDDESTGSFGTHGWAIFLSPTLAEQDNAVYGCDYNVQTGEGTYLNMDLSTVVQAQNLPGNPPSLLTKHYYFELQDPGGPNDEILGIMKMQTDPATGQPRIFPVSTDLESWHGMSWEAAGSPWEIIYGTGLHGGASAVPLAQGDGTDDAFSKTATTKDSSGKTNSVNVSLGAGISGDLKIKGFEVGISETLTAGYEGKWTSDTTTTTAFSQSLKIGYHFPLLGTECTGPECVKSLTVQPFILLSTDESAPWIPEQYKKCRPWCITWQVVSYCYQDGRCGGQTAAPARAEATIVGGGGVAEDGREEAAEKRWSDFAIHGGHLTWLDQDGNQTPIPIGADGFDPVLGVSVRINQREFRTDAALGRWTRNGQVWKYKTKKSVKRDAFTLKLNFGTDTWDFEAKKLDLAEQFPAGDLDCRVDLLINGMYLLSTRFAGEGELRFKQRKDNPTQGPLMGLTEYSGVLGSSGQDDHIKLAGTLPSDLPAFGDLLFAINGQETGVPLLALRDFKEAVEHGRDLAYDKRGIHLAIDFKKKTWSAAFKGEAAKAIMAPRWGGSRIAVKVGGEPWCTERLEVERFTAKLSYKS